MSDFADLKNNRPGENLLIDNRMNLFNINLKKVFRHRFDFEVGYLIKSPCRECRNEGRLPGCADGCDVLEKIQTILAESISCTRRS